MKNKYEGTKANQGRKERKVETQEGNKRKEQKGKGKKTTRTEGRNGHEGKRKK